MLEADEESDPRNIAHGGLVIHCSRQSVDTYPRLSPTGCRLNEKGGTLPQERKAMTGYQLTPRWQAVVIAAVLLLAGVVFANPATAAADVHWDNFCWGETLTAKDGHTLTDSCYRPFHGIKRAEAWSPQHSICLRFGTQNQERCSSGPGAHVEISAVANECYGNPECADTVWIDNNALSSSTVYGNVEWVSSSGGSPPPPPAPEPEPEGCPRQTLSSGYFANSTGWSVWNGNYSRDFADVNGDCRDDLVGWNSTTGDVQVGLSSGSYFAYSTGWGLWNGNWSRNFADVNGDGRADMVGWNATTGDTQVGLSTGSYFANSTGWGLWNGNWSRNFADVNGDGRADMVGRNSSTGNVQVGLSTGSSFANSTSWSSWSGAYSLAFADVNGDGKDDLVGRNSAGNVQVGLSTGGSFAASTSWSSWSGAFSMALADVNADGLADLVGRNSTTGDVQVGLSAATYFRPSLSWGPWSGAYSLQFADGNGDGRDDIVGWNSTTGDVQLGLSTSR